MIEEEQCESQTKRKVDDSEQQEFDEARAFRLQCRMGEHSTHSSGKAAGYMQANLIIIPGSLADSFRTFCELNSKACPLLEELPEGCPHPSIVADGTADLRTDLPCYRVFRDGEVVDEPTDITALWRSDLVAFLIGCSFTFDSILQEEGLDVRHVSEEKNVPMYKTNIPCQTSEPFSGSLVVSMRPFTPENVEKASEISSRFPNFHGGPVHVGTPNMIGIEDINTPDFGDFVMIKDDEIPVFWACGVTPQIALTNAKVDFAITHLPGHMFICDLKNKDVSELAVNKNIELRSRSVPFT